MKLDGPVYMISCEAVDRFSGLEIDLDLLIEFGKVCALEALEGGWSSLNDKLWMSGESEWSVERSRSTR